MRTVAVVQARTGSTRLPGKTLLPLAGRPLLLRMVERVTAAARVDDVVVATTTGGEDQPIRDLARDAGLACVSGHPTDLLDRHLMAARERRADVVVKIPSDCPLISTAAIDRVIDAYLGAPGDCDYCSNLHPATWPDGNDVEVVPAPVLAIAHAEAAREFEREHTTPFIWERPERFRLRNVAWESGLDWSMSHRFTIDYPEDYAFIAAVYDHLWTANRPAFTLEDIIALLDARPDLLAINRPYAGVNWYRRHLDELRTVGRHETREEPEDLKRSAGR